MGNFINIEQHVEPETTLFEQEINAILAVIAKIGENFAQSPRRGTIILDGQKYGDKAKLLIKANYPGGTYQRRFFRIYQYDSDEMAARSINEVLKWPDPDSRYAHLFKQELPQSGIYRDGELLVLILNAKYGRFLCSIKAETEVGEELHDEAKYLLYAMTECFAQMMQEDEILQESAKRIFLSSERFQIACAVDEVDEMFVHCTEPSLQTWRAWHEPANAAGELTLCFQ